ncbi:MAG: STAS domain-containing protein [Candidatus Krumholzibacteria bacterium]|nr:STAS domain-containing protein [Candidatus Krumholzibacteria bacterium]
MLRLKRREAYGAVIVDVAGNLMGGPGRDAEKLHDSIKAPLSEGKKNIVVNLHKVTRANSKGIGTLIGALTSVKNAGGEMVLTHVTDRINSVFITTQLNRIFKTFDTDDEALKYLIGDEENRREGKHT